MEAFQNRKNPQTELIRQWEDYGKLGITRLPVHLEIKYGKKFPTFPRGWKNPQPPYTIEDLTEYFDSIAVKCGKNLFVIDEDKQGALKAHGITDEDLQHIPSVKTQDPNHGPHYYFAWPEKLARLINLTRSNKAQGLDLRGEGGIIFSPPSQVVGGGKYKWIVPISPKGLPQVPQKIQDILVKLFPKSQATGELSEIPDFQIVPVPDRFHELIKQNEKIMLTWNKQRTDMDDNSRSGHDLSLGNILVRELYTDDEINAILLATPYHKASEKKPKYVKDIIAKVRASYKPHILTKFPQSDLGNTERLISFYGEDLAYCHAWKKWFIWNTQQWKEDEKLRIEKSMKEIIKKMITAAFNITDETPRIKWLQFCTISSRAYRIAGAISLARSDPIVARTSDDFDKDDFLFNVINGTIDLKNRRIAPAKRDNLITKIAKATYDPGASCPLWDGFLDKIMDGNQALIEFLQVAVGYSLTGDTSERAMFILYGRGANGKSTFLRVLEKIFGDYSSTTPTSTLYSKKYEGIPNDVARLKGQRFVIAIESEEERRLAESLVKQVTGGDKITARFMRGEWFEFYPKFKIFFATNHKPQIWGTDKAIWDRIRLIPFDVVIPDEEQDKHLSDKLLKESSGILNWALQGLEKWSKYGLIQPEEVSTATTEYRSEMDIIQQFLDEDLQKSVGNEIESGLLYDRFTSFCYGIGLKRAMNRNNFSRKLKEHGAISEQRGGKYYWQDYELKFEIIQK